MEVYSMQFPKTLLVASLLIASGAAHAVTTLQNVIAASRAYHAKQAVLAAMPEFSQTYETAKRAYTQAFKQFEGDFDELQGQIRLAIGDKSAKKLAEWNRKKQAAEQPVVNNLAVVAKAREFQAAFAAIKDTQAYTEYRAAKKAYKPTFAAFMKDNAETVNQENVIAQLEQSLGKKEAKKLSKWFKKLSIILAAQAH